MRYDRPELQEELAARYALGTMGGAARRRLRRLTETHAGLASRVQFWESRLNLLVESVPPVDPPPRVWQAIEDAIADRTENKVVRFPGERRRLRATLALWRGIGIAATAAAALLALYIGLTAPATDQQGDAIAILNDASGHPAFVATSGSRPGQIKITRLIDADPGTGHSYELWLLPKGAPPQSMGLLRQQARSTIILPAQEARLLASADGIAISVEPAGGSETGLPTGPVVFKGAVLLR